MNLKRYIAATFSLFIFIFIYQWLVDSYLLIGMYIETSDLWRDFREMFANIPLAICYMFVLSAWASYVFPKLCKDGGIVNGLLFGLYFGVFAGLLKASWYFWLPVSLELTAAWFLTCFIQVLGAGFILGVVYRKNHAQTFS